MEEDICDITLESDTFDVTLESSIDTDWSVDEFSSVELQVGRFRPTCAAAVLASCHSQSTPKKSLASYLQNVLPDPTIGKS